MDLPSSLDFIAAKKIIRISPIAKKFTINQENRSIACPQGSLENSKEAIHSKLIASFPVYLASIDCMPSASWMAEFVSVLENPLTSAVIKISEILSAATVTTGAKIIHITLFTLR